MLAIAGSLFAFFGIFPLSICFLLYILLCYIYARIKNKESEILPLLKELFNKNKRPFLKISLVVYAFFVSFAMYGFQNVGDSANTLYNTTERNILYLPFFPLATGIFFEKKYIVAFGIAAHVFIAIIVEMHIL